MELSLQTIHENLLVRYPASILIGNARPLLHGARILSEDVEALDPGFLYLIVSPDGSMTVTEAVQTAFENGAGACLVFGDLPETGAHDRTIIVPRRYNRFEVVNETLEIFARFEDWENATLAAVANDEPLSDILGLASSVTKDTVYLTDPSLKMLSHSSPTLMDEVSAIWKHQSTYGYMPMHIVRSLIDSGELGVLNTRRDAFTYPDTCFNLPYTCKNVFDDESLEMHLFIISIYGRPSETNHDIAEALGTICKTYLDSHPNLLSGYGSFHESFLVNILEGELANTISIQSQLVYFDWRIDDDYLLVTLLPDNQGMIGDRFLAERIEKNAGFDCAVFRHGNLVIMLCHDPDRDEIVSYLRSRAHSLGFIAAVSKRFSPLTTMPVIFDQTRRILDDGKSLNPGTRVFVDDDFGLRVIISKLLEQYSISELCHSGVLRLYENDREHGTDYTDTLLVFLENDRNVLQTSRSLFIHRNTLLRRLERISSFIDVNDCPASTRHYILFSLIVLKYCEQPEN